MPDGRIVAAGYSAVRDGQFNADKLDFVVARYLSNGTIDTSFNPGPLPFPLTSTPGTLRIDYGFTADISEAVAVELDGKYVVAGSVNNASAHNDNDGFGLARVNTNGSLDSSFGTGGQVTTPITNYIAGYDRLRLRDRHGDRKPMARFFEVGYAQTPDGREIAVIARYETGVVVQSISGAASVAEGATYTLTLSSSDPTTSQWTINWGDGTQVVPGNPTSVTHVYADGPQNYTISATVTDEYRHRSGGQHSGGVGAERFADAGDQRCFECERRVGVYAESVIVRSGHRHDQPVDDQLGRRHPSRGGNPSSVTHTYADGNASYTISATATDEDGTFAAGNTVRVTVNNVAPTLAISGASDVNEGSTYTLNLSSSDPGADTITQWTINWGDGTQVVSGNPSSVSHTYADGNANYTISATATDEDGTFAAGNTVAVAVHNVAPTLAISGASDVNEGSTYTLNLSSIDPGTDTITQWTINWGDGTQIVSGNPSSVTHTYADGNANYTISATATDEDGTFCGRNTVECDGA